MAKRPIRCYYLLALFLVGTTLLVFWPVCRHEFVLWDDQVNVYENPFLHPVTPSNLCHLWKRPHENLYIPLTYTIWAGIAHVTQRTATEKTEAQFNSFLFHAMNLVLHILSILVVFAILKILFANDWASCCGAMLFALHPLQVEPVAWVTGMKDVLCGLLSLVALWQYLKYVHSRATGYARRARANAVLATLAFILALFAKPLAVVVPVMAWLLANSCQKQGNLRLTFRNPGLLLAAWVVIAIPFIVITKLAQGTSLGFVTPLWARPLVAGDALSFYVYKLLFPSPLSIDYGRSPDYLLQHGWALITGLAPYALGGLLWVFRDRVQWLLASAAVFVIGLLPALGLIPFRFQNYSTVADRYMYLAMLGPGMVVAGLVSYRPSWISKSLVVSTCVVVVSLLGLRSSFQIHIWHANAALFEHALQVNPSSSASHNNHGSVLLQLGRTAEALCHYREAIRIRPKNAEAHNNLGIVLVSRGEVGDAIGHFAEALNIKPDFADAHYNLGIALSKNGKLLEAIAQYKRGLQIEPDDLEAHNNLGNALLVEGKIEEAIFHYQEVLRMDSNNTHARQNLSVAMAMKLKSE